MTKAIIPTEEPTPVTLSETPSPEAWDTSGTTWQPDVNRPLTSEDMRQAIGAIMFAIRHENIHIHASQDPNHKTKIYSLHDVQTAIDVFQKMCSKSSCNLFRLKVYDISERDSPSLQENPFAENSLYSMIGKIYGRTGTTEDLLTTIVAFIATLIHGEPRLKKHPKARSKDMQKSLDRFKVFFEVYGCPDVWYWPFIDLALYARDMLKQNGIKLGKGVTP
jgi:hypothetical protein